MTPEDDDSWLDDAAGPLVRPYAMTRGRARPANNNLDMLTMVGAARAVNHTSGLSLEHERVVELCQWPVSVAELGATLGVPLMVAKVLVSDLVNSSDIVVRRPAETVQGPDTNTLQAVLDGIRRL